jgi:hypothetical protein
MISTLTLRFRGFAARHDDLPAFHAAYLTGTLIVAALLNLGAFALLILVHVLLDIVKYRDFQRLSWAKTLEGTARESLVDGTLLLTALTFSIYFHHSAGFLASAGGVFRAEMTIVRGLFLLIPKITILHNVLCILSNLQHYYATMHPRLGKSLLPVERCYVICLALTVLLLIAAPALLHLTGAEYAAQLLHELTPGIV